MSNWTHIRVGPAPFTTGAGPVTTSLLLTRSWSGVASLPSAVPSPSVSMSQATETLPLRSLLARFWSLASCTTLPPPRETISVSMSTVKLPWASQVTSRVSVIPCEAPAAMLATVNSLTARLLLDHLASTSDGLAVMVHSTSMSVTSWPAGALRVF